MSKPKTPPACALDGCNKPRMPGAGYRFCCHEHAAERKRQKDRARLDDLRSERLSLRTHDRAESAYEGEARQKPIRPAFVATVVPGGVIRPPRPAPMRLYDNGPDAGRPTPFQDDMNAILDHGSPGRPPA